MLIFCFFFSSRRRHTRYWRDWSSDVCSSDLILRGRRIIWGGRAHVRVALWMGTLVAVQRNPAIRAFYQRLVAAGRPKQVALTAAMHKLLLVLNALLRQRVPWYDTTQPA